MNTLEVANQIIQQYPLELLRVNIENFVWGNKNVIDSNDSRTNLESSTQGWIASKSD